MMGQSRSLLSSLSLGFGLLACASLSPSVGASQSLDDYQISLSSPDIVDGGLMVVTAIHSDQARVSAGDPIWEGRFAAKVPVRGTPNFSDEVISVPFYSISPTELQGVFAVPYGMPPGDATLEIRSGSKKVSIPFVVRAGDYRSETLSVDAKHVSPPKKALIRIQKEQREIGKVYSTVGPERLWSGPFVLPRQSPMTSPFGTRRVYNGMLSNFHSGLDLKAKVGDKIFAPAPGRVVLAKDLYYTGYTVFLDHGKGLVTFYGHLSKLKVKTGQMVKTGQLLGLAGMTGRASGPHLHWGSVIHGVKFNPLDLTRVLR